MRIERPGTPLDRKPVKRKPVHKSSEKSLTSLSNKPLPPIPEQTRTGPNGKQPGTIPGITRIDRALSDATYNFDMLIPRSEDIEAGELTLKALAKLSYNRKIGAQGRARQLSGICRQVMSQEAVLRMEGLLSWPSLKTECTRFTSGFLLEDDWKRVNQWPVYGLVLQIVTPELDDPGYSPINSPNASVSSGIGRRSGTRRRSFSELNIDRSSLRDSKRYRETNLFQDSSIVEERYANFILQLLSRLHPEPERPTQTASSSTDRSSDQVRTRTGPPDSVRLIYIEEDLNRLHSFDSDQTGPSASSVEDLARNPPRQKMTTSSSSGQNSARTQSRAHVTWWLKDQKITSMARQLWILYCILRLHQQEERLRMRSQMSLRKKIKNRAVFDRD